MEIENASNPAEGVAPEIETEETNAGAGVETEDQEGSTVTDDEAEGTSEGDENGDGEDGGEAEEIELNFGGDKLRVPKGAIPEEVVSKISEFSKNLEAGYTKKFQDVAEQRKSIEARAQAVEKIQTLSTEALNTYSRGLSVKQELEQLQKIDVNALWQSNPDQARRVSDAISAKTTEFNSIVQQVQQLEGQTQQHQQAEFVRLRQEGEAAIEKRIPGFAQKHLPAVSEYMIQQGLPKEEVNNWPMNPLYTQVAYKAMLYDRMQAQAKKAAKPTATTAAPITPMKGGKGGTAQKDVSKMSAADMAKHLGLPG